MTGPMDDAGWSTRMAQQSSALRLESLFAGCLKDMAEQWQASMSQAQERYNPPAAPTGPAAATPSVVESVRPEVVMPAGTSAPLAPTPALSQSTERAKPEAPAFAATQNHAGRLTKKLPSDNSATTGEPRRPRAATPPPMGAQANGAVYSGDNTAPLHPADTAPPTRPILARAIDTSAALAKLNQHSKGPAPTTPPGLTSNPLPKLNPVAAAENRSAPVALVNDEASFVEHPSQLHVYQHGDQVEIAMRVSPETLLMADNLRRNLAGLFAGRGLVLGRLTLNGRTIENLFDQPDLPAQHPLLQA